MDGLAVPYVLKVTYLVLKSYGAESCATFGLINLDHFRTHSTQKKIQRTFVGRPYHIL